MTNTNNPLLCDPVEGACGLPASTSRNKVDVHPDDQPVKVIYFTDPICSSCWGIEPQLRKLKLEYGHILDIAYHMGGLLPDWSYNSGGISKPSDVAHHWDEVSVHYDMPIDGDVWLEDPLHSSYPPSIAFKAAQMQDEQKAIVLLRELREMVFLQKTNITRWEHIAIAAEAAGLDVLQLKTDYEGEAKANFESDLQLAKSMGVRGFPSVFLSTRQAIPNLSMVPKPIHITKWPFLSYIRTQPKKSTPRTGNPFFKSTLLSLPKNIPNYPELRELTAKNSSVHYPIKVYSR